MRYESNVTGAGGELSDAELDAVVAGKSPAQSNKMGRGSGSEGDDEGDLADRPENVSGGALTRRRPR